MLIIIMFMHMLAHELRLVFEPCIEVLADLYNFFLHSMHRSHQLAILFRPLSKSVRELLLIGVVNQALH